jgi:hypothetical protein
LVFRTLSRKRAGAFDFQPAATPPTLAQAVLWIARIGGFLVRKDDGAPGPHVLWHGFQHLPHITDMFLIMRRHE